MDSLEMSKDHEKLSAKYRKRADSKIKGILKRLKSHKISYKAAFNELSDISADNSFYRTNLWVYRVKYHEMQKLVDQYCMVVSDVDYRRRKDLRQTRDCLLEQKGDSVSKEYIDRQINAIIRNLPSSESWNLSDEVNGPHLHGIL